MTRPRALTALTLIAGASSISIRSGGIGQAVPIGAFAASGGAINLGGSIAIAGGSITLTARPF